MPTPARSYAHRDAPEVMRMRAHVQKLPMQLGEWYGEVGGDRRVGSAEPGASASAATHTYINTHIHTLPPAHTRLHTCTTSHTHTQATSPRLRCARAWCACFSSPRRPINSTILLVLVGD